MKEILENLLKPFSAIDIAENNGLTVRVKCKITISELYYDSVIVFDFFI